MLYNLHFERVEKHDFVLRNLPNRVHPKWVGGTIPFISFSGIGVKHGVFGAQNFLIVQLSLKSKTFFLITFNIYFSLKKFMSDWQVSKIWTGLDQFFRLTVKFEDVWTSQVQTCLIWRRNNCRPAWTILDKFRQIQKISDKFGQVLKTLPTTMTQQNYGIWRRNHSCQDSENLLIKSVEGKSPFLWFIFTNYGN